MMDNPLNEVLALINHEDYSEVGGAYNQKGVEFQKHWAIHRMITIANSNSEDFLFLFEAIQDVAILDSELNPTSISVYQLKMKGKGGWSWNLLTGFDNIPKTKPKKPPKIKPLDTVKKSPLGKLYASVKAIKSLKAQGIFVSNAPCELLLSDGTTAGDNLTCDLSQLDAGYLELLSKGLKTLHEAGGSIPNLQSLLIEKVDLPVNDPYTYIVGYVHKFLQSRSPEHAAQAQSFVDALLAKIAPLGTKTEKCKNIDEMRNQHGFSKKDFDKALNTVASIPDISSFLEIWCKQLQDEGMNFMDVTSIKMRATDITKSQLYATKQPEQIALEASCDEWLSSYAMSSQMKPMFDAAFSDLTIHYPKVPKPQILATLAIQAIKKCADQI